MSRLNRMLVILSLASSSAVAQDSLESCPSARQCNANCSIAFNSHWRYGSPGLQADMKICERHCMAKNPVCPPEESRKTVQPEQRGLTDLEPSLQKRQFWEKGQ